MAYNILLVDDSETVRAVLDKTLRMAEVPMGEVHHAANGQEALEVLRNNWIDVVFSDINMPIMNGIELLERMKGDDLLRSIPVVVVSTEGSRTRMDDLRLRGIKAYVRKPFTPEGLRKVMDQVMEARDA